MALLGTLISPKIDAKIRSRLSCCKYKNKSPDFKDILRERFKTKIMQNRRVLFEKMRTINEFNECVQDTLCDYLRTEIDKFDQLNISASLTASKEPQIDIEHELNLMKQIETELVEEQLHWILREYRKEETEFRDHFEAPLLCPVCQHGFLFKMVDRSIILCNYCPIQLYSAIGLEQLTSVLGEALKEHSNICNYSPQFTVINEPNSSGLFLICCGCSAFNLLC